MWLLLLRGRIRRSRRSTGGSVSFGRGQTKGFLLRGTKGSVWIDWVWNVLIGGGVEREIVEELEVGGGMGRGELDRLRGGGDGAASGRGRSRVGNKRSKDVGFLGGVGVLQRERRVEMVCRPVQFDGRVDGSDDSELKVVVGDGARGILELMARRGIGDINRG